jgi:enoyl-CoA hydratase
MDLKAFAGGNQGNEKYQQRMADDPDLHWKALLRHYRLRKPLIAAVEGYAVAGGTEILQATDIRVAGEGATFGVFEARRGLFPLGGSTVRLRRQIPFTIAMDILLTGRAVPAPEAKEIGLIGHVVPDGQALDKAMEIAGQIAANGPVAIEAIKRSVRETEGLPEEEALKIELEIGWPVFATEDAKEGAKAFAEKRDPVYKKK